MNIEQTLQEIKEESLQAFKNVFGDSLEEIKEETDKFIQESEERAKKWAIDVIQGYTNQKGLTLLLLGEKDGLKIRLLKIAGIKQIEAEKLKDDLIEILINKLVSLAENN